MLKEIDFFGNSQAPPVKLTFFYIAIAKFTDAFIEGQNMWPPLGFKRPYLVKKQGGALAPPCVKKRVEACSQHGVKQIHCNQCNHVAMG